MSEDHDDEESAEETGPTEEEDAGSLFSGAPPVLMEAISKLNAEGDSSAASGARRLQEVLARLAGSRPPANDEEARSLSLADKVSDLIGGNTPERSVPNESRARLRSRIEERRATIHSRLDGRRAALGAGGGGGGGAGSARPYKVDEIPLASIVVGQLIENARINYGEDDYQSLRSSVASSGVNTPISVREGDRPDEYFLITGEHRVRAAHDVGMTHVAAMVYARATPILDIHFIHLRENCARKNLTDYEVAARCVFLAEKFDLSQSEISRETGIKESTIKFLCWVFSRLPFEILDAWKTGDAVLSRRILQRLAMLDHDAAIGYWTEWRARLETAHEGPAQVRGQRIRRQVNRPSDSTIARAWLAAKQSTFSALSPTEARALVVQVLEFAQGQLPALPFFDPRRSSIRAPAKERDDRGDNELPLPSQGQPFSMGDGQDDSDELPPAGVAKKGRR